jgi:hypothetical protein
MLNLKQKKFGHLTGLNPTEKRSPKGEILWQFLCICGRLHNAVGSKVKAMQIISCGCTNKNYKQGKCNTATYRAWAEMRNRCLNKNKIRHLKEIAEMENISYVCLYKRLRRGYSITDAIQGNLMRKPQKLRSGF